MMRCNADTLAGVSCALPARFGVLCARHARQLSSAGTARDYCRMRTAHFSAVLEHDLQSAVEAYRESGGFHDRPADPEAWLTSTLDFLTIQGEATTAELAVLLADLTARACSTRKAGAFMRSLRRRGLADKRVIQREGRNITLWRPA